MRYATCMQRLLTLCVIALLGVAPVGAQERRVDVIVEPVTLAQERIRVLAVGRAQALRAATLRTDASGTIERVHFQPNDTVKRGEPLVELDDREQRINLALAEVRDEQAQRLLNRYERTIGTGSVAATTIDEARRDAKLAALEVQQAQVALEKRTLTAPFTGRTGISEVEPGERVAEDTIVTTLDERTRLRVRFQVSEQFYEALAIGDQVELSPWSRPQTRLTAVIERRASRVQTDSGTVAFDAQLDNQADRFRPGMSFRVRLSLPGERLAQVPETAVQWGDDGAYVWVIDANKAQRVGIDLSTRQDNTVLVRGAIKPGDQVVREGVQRLREASPVRVLER